MINKELFMLIATITTMAGGWCVYAQQSANEQIGNFETATSFNSVEVEPDLKAILLFEACGEIPQALASEGLQNLDQTTLISRTTRKGAVIGENTVQQPNWTLTATATIDQVAMLTADLEALYASQDCAATALIGDYIRSWNREPSRTDPQGLWAADLQYLSEGMFETYRDYLIDIQPLYDQYKFENVARIINIEKIDLARPIDNLEIPDIATTTYIANFQVAFEEYREDPRFPGLRDRRAAALQQYINFTGSLEPKD